MKSGRLLSAGRAALAALVSIFLSTAVCTAATFSADYTSAFGKRVTSGKIYVKENKLRRESKTDQGLLITIVRADKQVTWQIRTWAKEYVEYKRAKLISPDPEELKKTFEAKEAGEDTIEGYVCKKTVYVPREGEAASITVWMSEKLNWPLKVQVNAPGGGSVVEYKNIRIGRLDDKLFEVPAGYKNVTPVPPAKSAKPAKKEGKS